MEKIIAFAGSNHKQSINHQLVLAAAGKLPGKQVTVLNLVDFPLPIYSEDLQLELGIPQKAVELYQIFAEADGFVIAVPEHNGLMPAFFKNVIDWLSRIDRIIFYQKPVMLLSTSDGSNGGNSSLQVLFDRIPFWGAYLVSSYSLPHFRQHFNLEKKEIVNDVENGRFTEALAKFSASVSESVSFESVI